MKKKLLLIFILLFGVGLFGCSTKNKTATDGFVKNVKMDYKIEHRENKNIKFNTGYHCISRFNNYFDYDCYYKNDINGVDDLGVRYKTFIINNESEIENLMSEKKEYLAKYDSDYFKEKSLLIIYYLIPTSGSEVMVTNIIKKDGKLLITTDVKLGIMDALSQGVTVLEISKDTCKNIKSIEISK